MDLAKIRAELEKAPKSWGHIVYEKALEILATHGVELTCKGRVNLGRCYRASCYEVRSTEKLSYDLIYQLKDMGLFGCGQEFIASDIFQEDGKWIVKAETRVDSSD